MAIHIVNEANKCLNCKKPLCQQGCPVHTPIPKVIAAFKEKKLNEAGQMLFENNPMSMICSIVCDHGSQCEGHCVLGKKKSPVHFSSIENYISDTYFDRMKINCKPANGKKVAVIGAGPAGLTIAFKLAPLGYDVTIFEERSLIGGIMQYGIPEFRLHKSILERYHRKLVEIGVKVRPNTVVGGAVGIGEMLRDGYDSIFIGTGAWRPIKLGIKGESLGNVIYGLDYLRNTTAFQTGAKVAVIGVGNAAMDVARSALRNGAEKVDMYGRSMNYSASEHEIEYAMLEGADMHLGAIIQEINEKGPVFVDGSYDEDGKLLSTGEPYQVEADSTIIAISQRAKSKIVKTTSGLDVNERGLLIIDENCMTTVPGVFAAGDVVMGPRNVVMAVNQAKIAAEGMIAYMNQAGE